MIRLRQSGVDEILIKRVRDWYDPGPGCFFSGISGTASFSPTSLFAAGEQGAYFDPNNSATLFEDAAGTIPTALERPVGLMRDLSGRGNHATSSSTARPTLTRRVNLLSNTEAFDNAYWSKNNTTISATKVTDPKGATTAQQLFETATTGGHSVANNLNTAIAPASAQLKNSIYIKPNGRTKGLFSCVKNAGNFDGWNIYFDLSNKSYTVTTNGTGTHVSTTITGPDAQGFYLIESIGTVGAFTNPYSYISTRNDAGSESFLGDVTKGFIIWGADLRETNTGVGLPAYQRVGNTSINAADYDTTGFPAWLRCSGGQSMVTPSINFTGTDKMTVWAGVRKLSDASSGAIIETSTGGSAGSFLLNTPSTGGQNNYQAVLYGPAQTSLKTASTYVAPITNVLAYSFDTAGADYTSEITAKVNGATPSTQAGSGSVTGNFGNYPLYLFARNQSSLFFSGLAGPIIVRGAQSSAAEIANAENWINAQQKVY